MTHPSRIPSLVYSDGRGTIRDFPDLAMAGMAGGVYFKPALRDLVPLPDGSELFSLPGRLPVGIEPGRDEPVQLAEIPELPGTTIQAVAAFMAPAYTATYCAAYLTGEDAPRLPLFAYTAVGWHRGRFWAAGFRCDEDTRQDTAQFDEVKLRRVTSRALQRHPDNRLVRQLGTCCLEYRCPAARNYFLGRWEAPLPTSPSCNARCLGCISLQPSQSCPATQQRLDFVPTVDEITAVAVPHLDRAPRPVVSFGQGCEGEPLLQDALVAAAITAIRRRTGKGTINLNSNASLPEAVERLAAAGLDSLRVSLNSARESCYEHYYRPSGYRLSDVVDSISIMKRRGRFVSLNYFILPGFTDSEWETAAFMDLIEQTRPDFIQLRNLNMDPEWYLSEVDPPPRSAPFGIRPWLARLRQNFPFLRFGYFNPCLNP